MSKIIEKRLKALAANLPKTAYQALEQKQLTLEDIDLGGHDISDQNFTREEVEKGEINVKVPVVVQENHARRLRRCFKSGGIKAVMHYLKPYIKKGQGYEEQIERWIVEGGNSSQS